MYVCTYSIRTDTLSNVKNSWKDANLPTNTNFSRNFPTDATAKKSSTLFLLSHFTVDCWCALRKIFDADWKTEFCHFVLTGWEATNDNWVSRWFNTSQFSCTFYSVYSVLSRSTGNQSWAGGKPHFDSPFGQPPEEKQCERGLA